MDDKLSLLLISGESILKAYFQNMTSRNKNRWIVNLKIAARELEMASTKLTRRAALERHNCRDNMKKGKMEEAKINAEKSIQEKNLMENYIQSSKRLKSLITFIQSKSSQDKQIQCHMEGLVRLIEVAMKNRHLKNVNAILDKHGQFFLALTEEAESKLLEEHDNREAKILLQEIAKEENIEFEKVFVKKVKSCLSQSRQKLQQ